MSPVLYLKPGTIFAGDFRIVSPLNTGGMGAVYVADQLSTGSQRALKIMLPELLNDTELRERFLREARVCARIQSDHVVQVVAAGIDQATSMPWLAMELLHGEDLSEYIERRGSVSPSGLIEIYRQLCHALGAAHGVGVVHRDLKPENIFLAISKRAGAPFTVKVLDFGIAKMIADASARMTALIGSPLWMAPEQMDPRMPISSATDVWPLGLLAFWLLTGQHYWRSARIKPLSMHAIMREVLFEPISTATERAAEYGAESRIPVGFDQWFVRSMTRETTARLKDATEALDELERCLGNGPRGTMPPHPPPSLDAVQDRTAIEIDAQADFEEELAQEGYGAAETAPPTLQSNVDEVQPAPAPPPPVAHVSVPMSSGPATSTNGIVASDEMARRSSAPSVSVLPLKSAAPLWMLGAALVILLVVIGIFVQRGIQHPPSLAATAPPVTATALSVTTPPPPAVTATSAATTADTSVTMVTTVATTVAAPPATAPPAPTAQPTASAIEAPTFPASSSTADPSGGGKGFNPVAATAALKSAAVTAKGCKRSFGPTGSGVVKVTFAPSGNVISALLITPQYAGTLVGTCVATQFQRLRIPPFEGTPVTTNMPFEIPQ